MNKVQDKENGSLRIGATSAYTEPTSGAAAGVLAAAAPSACDATEFSLIPKAPHFEVRVGAPGNRTHVARAAPEGKAGRALAEGGVETRHRDCPNKYLLCCRI